MLISGAVLVSARAGHPLEVGKSALLKLNFNRCSPVSWDTKLGIHRGSATLRALGQVDTEGGLVASTLVLVARKYPLMFTTRRSGGGVGYQTMQQQARTYEQASKKMEAIQRSVEQQVQAQEQEYCRSLIGRSQIHGVSCLYANMVLQGDINSWEHCWDDLKDEEKGEMQRLLSQRKAIMQKHREQLTMQDCADGGEEPALANAGTAVLRLKVSEVHPKAMTGGTNLCEALVKIWRPTEEQDAIREGEVYLVRGLTPGKTGRYLGGRQWLELHSTYRTQWQCKGFASKLDDEYVYEYKVRAQSKMTDLSRLALNEDFDYQGLIVSVGPLVSGDHGMLSQWVFLVDETCPWGLSGEKCQLTPLLAVLMQGTSTSVDWLSDTQKNNGAVRMRDISLKKWDARNCMWVAGYYELSSLTAITLSHFASDPLKRWLQQAEEVMEHLRARVTSLLV